MSSRRDEFFWSPTAPASRAPDRCGRRGAGDSICGIHPAQISRSGRPRPPDCPGVPVAHQVMIRRSARDPAAGGTTLDGLPLHGPGSVPSIIGFGVGAAVANGVGISDVRPAALAVPLRFRVGRQTHWLPGMDVRYGRSRCGGHGGGLPLLVGGGCSWWAHSQCAPRCQRPVCWALLTDPWVPWQPVGRQHPFPA